MNHEMHEKHEKILNKEECYRLQGEVFDVYKEMGCGFLESVYQECLEIERYRRQIPFESKKEFRIFYKHEPLAQIIRMAN